MTDLEGDKFILQFLHLFKQKGKFLISDFP